MKEDEDREYVAACERDLESAVRLFEEQTARIDLRFQTDGVQPHRRELRRMARSSESIHWQRALLLWRKTDPEINLKDFQPSPALSTPPRIILKAICAELKQQTAPSEMSPAHRVQQAVKMAVAKARSVGHATSSTA